MESQGACRPNDILCIAEDLLARWQRLPVSTERRMPDPRGECLLCLLEDGDAEL